MPKKQTKIVCVAFRPAEDVEKMLRLAKEELGWTYTRIMNEAAKAYLGPRYGKHLKF